jgi:hypothetical protein
MATMASFKEWRANYGLKKKEKESQLWAKRERKWAY